jgi:hypothetical protein
MKEFLDSDWLKGVEFYRNAVPREKKYVANYKLIVRRLGTPDRSVQAHFSSGITAKYSFVIS